jgi:hypothetical protein
MQSLSGVSRIARANVACGVRVVPLVSLARATPVAASRKITSIPTRMNYQSVFRGNVLPGSTRGASTASLLVSYTPTVSKTQLKQLAVCSAIPMIGFGMMDQFIMVTVSRWRFCIYQLFTQGQCEVLKK